MRQLILIAVACLCLHSTNGFDSQRGDPNQNEDRVFDEILEDLWLDAKVYLNDVITILVNI